MWRVMVVALGALTVLGGCGESSPTELERAMEPLQQRLDTCQHNLAHAHVVGFRAVAATDYPPYLVQSPGPMTSTDASLDLAIGGEGFFELVGVSSPAVMYTRAGHFFRNAEGRLITRLYSRDYLLASAPPIPSDTAEVSIHPDGRVILTPSGSAKPGEAGRLKITCFPHPGRLYEVLGPILMESEASGPPITLDPGETNEDYGVRTAGMIRQGFLEGSNVDVEAERRKLEEVEIEIDQLLRKVNSGDR